MKDVDPKFSAWACSLSGCDGGDPSAPVWISGIEWGYGKRRGQTDDEYEEAVSSYYSMNLPDEIAKGRYEPRGDYLWQEHLTYPFGRSVAKLFMALNGLGVENYNRIAEMDIDSKIFKLNLYPIAFRHAGDKLWAKYHIGDLTGLDSKEVYRTWCFLNRFPFIAETVKRHNPKLIIGIGVTYLTDFFACFAGTGGSGNIHIGELQPDFKNKQNHRRYYWSKINSGRTLLAVIPFFSSQYGLN
ncbi:MAG TPA: hypothetical protein ENN79_05715, partial [Desulfobacteraceae bacterium]|nr:hypothetical protein [Desulfobacteraceae bacterium]